MNKAKSVITIQEKADKVVEMRNSGFSCREIMSELKIGRSTLYRYLSIGKISPIIEFEPLPEEYREQFDEVTPLDFSGFWESYKTSLSAMKDARRALNCIQA